DRVHGRANGASSVKHVVDNDERASFQWQRQFRRAHNGQFRTRSDIVAVHRHVNHSGFEVDLFDLVNKTGDAPRNLHATGGNSCEHDLFQLRVALDYFVRNPPKRPTNCLRVHDWDGGRWILFFLFHAFPWRPRWIALKEQKNQEADFSVRASFIRRSRQLERCFSIQSSKVFSKPMSLPAFSLSIHLCFKISVRSARNSLYRTEFLTN